MSRLETAGDNHLDVPDHQRDWPALGPFGSSISDQVNSQYIIHDLKRFFGPERYNVLDDDGDIFILADPQDAEVIRRMEAHNYHLENCGPLDECAFSDALQERIREEWDGMPLSYRLHVLMHADADLSGALADEPPDEAYEPLEEMLYEQGLV